MKYLFFLFFLVLILATAGCAGVSPNSAVTPTPQIVYVTVFVTQTPVPAPNLTLTPAPAMTPVPASPPAGHDPIIGTWVGYKYLATGRIQLVWNFMENNTFVLVNTNMKALHKKYVNGTWKKGGTATYQLSPQDDTFTYDPVKDELSETFFLVPFTRVTDPATLVSDQLLAMNITVSSAQVMHEFKGSHYAGYNYLVTSISIRNFNETGGYSFTDDRIRVVLEDQRGMTAMNQKLPGKIDNPFPSVRINPGEVQQGTVVFAVPTESKSYILRLIRADGSVISNDAALNNVPVNASFTTGPA
jgi:hypothetical protein